MIICLPPGFGCTRITRRHPDQTDSFDDRTKSNSTAKVGLYTTRRRLLDSGRSRIERARRDLNSRHLGPEPSALSTELRAPHRSDTESGNLIFLFIAHG